MTDDDVPADRAARDEGATTSSHGTPMAVDIAADPRTRRDLAMFVASPIVWFAHFMLVYVVAEAGCTGDGTGLTLFDPPVPTVVTLAATGAAVLACLAIAVWEYRRWHGDRQDAADDGVADMQRHGTGGALAFIGFLLALASAMSVLFVGLPALALPAC